MSSGKRQYLKLAACIGTGKNSYKMAPRFWFSVRHRAYRQKRTNFPPLVKGKIFQMFRNALTSPPLVKGPKIVFLGVFQANFHPKADFSKNRTNFPPPLVKDSKSVSGGVGKLVRFCRYVTSTTGHTQVLCSVSALNLLSATYLICLMFRAFLRGNAPVKHKIVTRGQ